MHRDNVSKMKKSQHQLKAHNIRSTEMRLSVLDLFHSKNIALSKQDLEEQLSNHDRITLYRTLKTFEDKGLIHKVFDTSDKVKYALCSHVCNAHQHEDQHIHFECTICKQTTCLDDIPIPTIQLPKNYQIDNIALAIQGICNSCN